MPFLVKIHFLAIFLVLYIDASPVFGQTPLVKLEASRAENIGAYRPNSQGVHPVRLRWPVGAVPGNFHVYRSGRADTGFERISVDSAKKDENGFITFIDDNLAAAPGVPYYYRIMIVNSSDEASLYSETIMGYGALSPECYFRECSKTLASSHQKLTYMHKSGAMSKLGSEQKPGAISGTLAYQARVAGLGGRVTMEYDRYADFYIDNNRALGPYFVLTGNMNTTASMSQNGTMDGTVRISGMYPGQIHYDKIQIKNGAAGGGTYGVEPEGFPRAEISWTIGEH